jgi:serine/threonine-protein kinase
VAWALLLGAPAAWAQKSSDARVAAEALFDEGKRLMKAHSYSEACAKFAASHEMDPALGTLLNLANCYEQAGRTASAWAAFREAGDLAKTAGDIKRATVARERAAGLDPKLLRLTLKVPSKSQVPGLEIQRDGVVVSAALFGAAIPVDPGSHRVVATAQGHKSFQQEVLVKGEGRTFEVVVPVLEAWPTPAAPEPPPVLPAPPPPPEAAPAKAPAAPMIKEDVPVAAVQVDAPDPKRKRRIVGQVLVGVGAVGVAVGGYFGLDAMNKHKEFQDACDPGVDCDADDVALERDAKKWGDMATIAMTVGGGALISGLVLWWTAVAAEASPSSSTSARIVPSVSSDSIGLVISGGY